MSATIASTLAKLSAQRVSAKNAHSSDVSLASVGFSSLLLGQMTANADLPQDTRLVPGQGRTLQANSERSNSEAALQDPSILLATLGFAVPEQGHQIDPMNTNAASLTQDLNGSLNSLAGASLDLIPTADAAASRGRASLPDASTIGGKPAIIAGTDFALPKTDSALTQVMLDDKGIKTPLANGIPAAQNQAADPALLKIPASEVGFVRTSDVGKTSTTAPVVSLTPAPFETTSTADPVTPLVPDTLLGKAATTDPVAPLATDTLSKTTTTDPIAPLAPDTFGKTATTNPAVVAPPAPDILGNTAMTDPVVPLATDTLGNTAATNPVVVTHPATDTLGKTATTNPVAPLAPDTFGKTATAETLRATQTEASSVKIPVSDLAPADFSTQNVQNIAHSSVNATGGSTSPAQIKIDTPLRDPAWANDFSQKIVWMASNDKQVVQITLNPPDMGPIEVSLNLSQDSASAIFSSPHAEVRETIEAALPRLKEMLANVGIELGQSNVGNQSFRQQAENQEARQGSPRWSADNAILGTDLPSTPASLSITARGVNGLVNTFA